MYKNIKKIIALLVILVQLTGVDLAFAGNKDLPIVLGNENSEKE